MTRTDRADSATLRVAFYGRVAREDGDAQAIARQYEQCRRALPTASITAVFYDIGADSASGWQRAPARPTIGDSNVRRDGGLHDLLTEARFPSRRFDYVIACGPDRLSRHAGRAYELLDRLRRIQIQPLFPFSAAQGLAAAETVDLLPVVRILAKGYRSRASRRGNGR